MNEYIKVFTDEVIQHYFEGGISDDENLIIKVKRHLYDIKSEKDKVDILTTILEANENEYQNHLLTCPNKTNCSINKKHLKVNYFLHQELEEFGMSPTDNFSFEEKEKCNDKLDALIEELIHSNQLVSDQILKLTAELEELKTLYVLGKKNWKQQLAGKLSGMVASGVIAQATAQPIIDNVLMPATEFVSNLLG